MNNFKNNFNGRQFGQNAAENVATETVVTPSTEVATSKMGAVKNFATSKTGKALGIAGAALAVIGLGVWAYKKFSGKKATEKTAKPAKDADGFEAVK